MKNSLIRRALASLALASTSVWAQASDFTFDVAGVETFHELGVAGNVQRTYFIAPHAYITSVSFNVSETAFGPSWLSDIAVDFGNTALTGGFDLFPIYFGHDAPGTFENAKTLALGDLSFGLDADGLVHVEFFEAYDDPEVDPDGRFNYGTITLTYDVAAPVPEPGSWVLMLGGLVLTTGRCRVRRKRSTGFRQTAIAPGSLQE